MTYATVKQNIWSNAISNYLRTFVGIVVGLVTFRLLYQALPRESFGFWSLLWSVFGYGILLDFGFGFAAQKRVAELSGGQMYTAAKIEDLNKSYDAIQQQIGYEIIRGPGGTAWLRLGVFALTCAVISALVINRRLPT